MASSSLHTLGTTCLLFVGTPAVGTVVSKWQMPREPSLREFWASLPLGMGKLRPKIVAAVGTNRLKGEVLQETMETPSCLSNSRKSVSACLHSSVTKNWFFPLSPRLDHSCEAQLTYHPFQLTGPLLH